MALRDISNVTTTLINLIDRSFRVPENWPAALPVPRVMAEPPVRTPTNGIGIFLYHMMEDPHFKNLPAPGRDTPPVRYTSMALTLYFQLSAYQASADVEGEQDGLMEQQMMAVAMKALHDYPELTDDTVVEGALDAFNVPITDPVFPIDILGRSNRFKIVFQPIMPAEAVSFWTTGDSSLTLSAYYEVSVILLEPETSRIRTGRVLDYNVFTFVSGNPKILYTSNEVAFTSPINAQTRTLILQPAQVPPAPAVLPPDPSPYLLTIKGMDFNGSIFLRLTHALWSEPAVVNPPTWQPSHTVTELNVVVRESALVESSLAPIDILPGIYGAQVVYRTLKNKHDGTQWELELTSNVSPFAIVPRIDILGVPAALAATATVTGYLFSRVSLGNQLISLEVFIGPNRLSEVTVAPNPGEFQITSDTTLDYVLPPSVASGDTLPFRVIANGAESAPRWITAP